MKLEVLPLAWPDSEQSEAQQGERVRGGSAVAIEDGLSQMLAKAKRPGLYKLPGRVSELLDSFFQTGCIVAHIINGLTKFIDLARCD